MKYFAIVLFCAILGFGCAQLPANQDHPCDHPHGVVGDVTYCDRYWECVGDTAELYDCPNGLVFVGRNRGIAEGCDYPWRGSYCQSSIRGVNEEKGRANPPISTEHCGWLYGIFGHETSCTRYWTCWNGTATEQFCIGGLLYNEETHACDWPQNVVGCQKHPLCKDDPNANVPLGQSCERYWACQGGYPRLQRCPATLVFDKISRRCLSPPTNDCEAPPPPPPSEDTLGEQSQFRTGGGPPRRQTNRNRQRQPVQQQQQVQQFSPADQFVQEQRNQEFVDVVEHQPDEQFIEDTQPRLQNQLPLRPRPRVSLQNLPNIPQGAVRIDFNNRQQQRPAPIEGAIPLK